MRTRPVFSDDARTQALRARLARPTIIEIDGATAYWLEDASGGRASPVSPSSAEPLRLALAEHDGGGPAMGVLLVCRLADGERYEIGGGIELLDAALAAAGRPRLQRPLPGHAAAS
jgi:hypothetical protein